MYLDWPSLALGLGVGLGLAVILARILFGEAWTAYRQRQQEREEARQRQQDQREAERQAWMREQEYRQAERIAAILRDIDKTRSADSADSATPQKDRASAEELYFEELRRKDEAEARIKRLQHIMNYKSGV